MTSINIARPLHFTRLNSRNTTYRSDKRNCSLSPSRSHEDARQDHSDQTDDSHRRASDKQHEHVFFQVKTVYIAT